MNWGNNEIVAVIFSILIATSMVATPALASGPNGITERTEPTVFGNAGPPGQSGANGPPDHAKGNGASNQGADANQLTEEFSANTSLEALFEAAEQLAEFDPETQAERDAVNETFTAMNGSMSEFRTIRGDADSEAAFERLRDAQNQISDLAAEFDDETVENVSRLLYEASALAADRSIRDAEIAFERNEDAFPNRGQQRKTERAIDNANRALERGSDAASDDPPRRGPPGDAVERTIENHANAITHHATAWRHAQRALETTAEHTEPTLTLRQRQTFEENGSIHVLLEVELNDVRAHEFDGADVHLEDGTTESLEFDVQTRVSTVRGVGRIELGPEPKNETVTVTATSTADPDRSVKETTKIRIDENEISWDLPAPDEYAEAEVTDEDSGVTVSVTGDGVHESLLSVEDRTPETSDPYRAGPMVRIVNETSFDQAEVTVPVDEAALEREGGNLSIVTWDPNSEEPWTPIETEIDREAGTATAEVDHFSFFSAFWIEEWEDQYSDTITLDDNQTDGGVDDGADFQLIDVMFVVDESGSMSGSRIRNARDASKRFVGALTDEEQAGLVGYAYGGSLKHHLTRDHDSLNESIDTLNAGGSTNTARGLSEALNEFERNGWENRSQTIILLSDGHTTGLDPIPTAETAADRDIEISTIGVGNNIDEEELREIAATTGGDFYHVEDADDLPDTFERVAENQTEVQLQDTNRDGIPDLVAEMDLAMPTGPDGVVGEPLDLDPIALDTSGDGILDNETVDINYRVFQEGNETKLHASVTYASHHPAIIDTTGDGLTDAQQIEGWEIDVVDNSDDAQELIEVAANPDDPRDASSFFSTRDVSADPLLDDTDGEGLPDAVEFELGTDPEQIDTTSFGDIALSGDGIPDDEALEDPDEDPTVFSTSPPEIYLEDFDEEWTLGEWKGCERDGIELPDCEYERPGYKFIFEIRVEDPHGVSYVELEQTGATEFSDTYSTQYGVTPIEVEEEIDFYAEGEKVFSGFRGANTVVTAEDKYGNRGSTTVASKRSIGGHMAEEADWVHQTNLGAFSGFTHAAAELPDFFRLLLKDPVEIGEALTEFSQEYMTVQLDPTRQESQFWMEMVRGMAADTHRTQDTDNPHQKPGDTVSEAAENCLEQNADTSRLPSKYCQFASGWYLGYSSYLVLETVVGSKGTLKGVSSAGDLRKALDDAGDAIDSGPGLRQVDNINTKTGKVTHRIVADGGSPHIDAPAVRRHLREDHGMETVGSVNQAMDQLEGLGHLDELSSSEQAVLAARLSRSSDSSAARTFVNELDDVNDVRHLLDEDVAMTNRLVDWHANPGDYRLIDPDLKASDYVHVARHGEIDSRTLIVRGTNGDGDNVVRWLEDGDSGFGRVHIRERHITGTTLADDDITSLFPVGKSIQGRDLPNTLTTQQIEDLVYDAIKRGRHSGGSGNRQEYMFQPTERGYPDSGISQMRVVVEENGAVKTAFPEQGSAVAKWHPEHGWIQ